MFLTEDLKIKDLENLKELIFEGNSYKPIVRKFKDIKDLYLNPVEDDEKDMYYMFRDITIPELKDKMEREQIRIDVTVMENVKVGKEYNKTHGHHHPEAAPGRTFPEIYKVLEGKICFILQKNELELVNDVIIVEMNKDEWIIIPPNYGHVMINLNNGPSVTLNIVSNRFSSIYEIYRKFKGAAYYLIEDGLLANKNYIINCKPRFFKSKFSLNNIYENISQDNKIIKALNRPYLIRDYFIFFEEIMEMKFPVLA